MMEHREQNGKLIDTRQVMWVALHAVAQAYLQGTLTLEDLRAMQTELDYNSHKLQDEFGSHAFFDLANEIESLYAEYSTFGDKLDEAWFRRELNKLVGVQVVTGSSNILVTPEPFELRRGPEGGK